MSILLVVFGVIPFSWFLVIPIITSQIYILSESNTVISYLASISFMNLLFFLCSILIIEVISDYVLQPGRLFGLFIGSILAIVITVSIQLLSAFVVQSMPLRDWWLEVEIIRSIIYAPVIWGLVVWGANSKKFAS